MKYTDAQIEEATIAATVSSLTRLGGGQAPDAALVARVVRDQHDDDASTRLQDWCSLHAPRWGSGIGMIDAAFAEVEGAKGSDLEWFVGAVLRR